MDKVDTQERTGRNNPFDTQRMDLTTMRLYWITLGLSILMVVLGIVFHSILDLIVAAVVMIIVIVTIKHDRKFVHIPPMIIILIMICVICSTISGIVFEVGIMSIVQYVLIGMILSLTGFVCAYLALGKIPGFSDERPFLMALEAFTFGVAAYAIFIMATRYVGLLVDVSLNYNELFDRMGYVTLGSFIVTTAFYLDMTHLFKHTVFNFMYHNQEALGVKAENERLEVEHLITLGESDTLEFKSTLRTNLKTGEKDKRMEKAVLKTLVAFLNSEGGTLLIGVTDDGNILGVDEESFDNRDKLNLHMTNLISSQIGDEFLPYIRFKLIEFGDRAVMNVVCKRCRTPVFLRENKTEQYYVRSGPSSVELIGSDMVKYIGSKQNVKRLRMRLDGPDAPWGTSEE